MSGKQQRFEFDLVAGRELRDAGMEEAAGNRSEILVVAKAYAWLIAMSREDRTCTADDVQLRLIANGYDPADLGNAAGSIFRDQRWRNTGRMIQSTRKSRHANRICVCELV